MDVSLKEHSGKAQGTRSKRSFVRVPHLDSEDTQTIYKLFSLISVALELNTFK